MKRYVIFTYTKEELSHVFVTDKDTCFGSNQSKYSIDSKTEPDIFGNLEQNLGMLSEVGQEITREEIKCLFDFCRLYGKHENHD